MQLGTDSRWTFLGFSPRSFPTPFVSPSGFLGVSPLSPSVPRSFVTLSLHSFMP